MYGVMAFLRRLKCGECGFRRVALAVLLLFLCECGEMKRVKSYQRLMYLF